jgi:hypothetical protein
MRKFNRSQANRPLTPRSRLNQERTHSSRSPRFFGKDITNRDHLPYPSLRKNSSKNSNFGQENNVSIERKANSYMKYEHFNP